MANDLITVQNNYIKAVRNLRTAEQALVAAARQGAVTAAQVNMVAGCYQDFLDAQAALSEADRLVY